MHVVTAPGSGTPGQGNRGGRTWRGGFNEPDPTAVLIGIVYFSPTFSNTLLFLGFPWAVTAPLFMLMLAIMLRRRQSASAVALAEVGAADS